MLCLLVRNTHLERLWPHCFIKHVYLGIPSYYSTFLPPNNLFAMYVYRLCKNTLNVCITISGQVCCPYFLESKLKVEPWHVKLQGYHASQSSRTYTYRKRLVLQVEENGDAMNGCAHRIELGCSWIAKQHCMHHHSWIWRRGVELGVGSAWASPQH